MNRAHFQNLAETRIEDAKTLLDGARGAGAYYFAGYAVECGLKACILHRVEREGVIFAERKFSEKCWPHSVEVLVEAAGLKVERDLDAAMNPNFSTNWGVVKDWTESDRYENHDEAKARSLIDAITETTDGALPWIQLRW
jgi:hypothetical protein